MSLIGLEGFDDQLFALKWGSITGTQSLVAGRTGQGRQFTAGTGDTGFKRFLTSTEEHATLIVGGAFKQTVVPSTADRGKFLHLKSDSDAVLHLTFQVTPTGAIWVRLGSDIGTVITGSEDNTIIPNVFHYVEVLATLSDTVGVVQVKVDGALVVDASGLDTKNAGTKTVFDTIYFVSAQVTDSIRAVWDDIYLGNGAGAAPWSGFLGDVQIETKFPDGNGYLSQWVGSDLDSVDNFLLVDENPPDGDTTYVESSTDGNIDAYTVGTMTAAGIVRGVQLIADARHTGAADTARVFARIAAVNHNGPDAAPAANYAGRPSAVWGPSPATAVAWTPAEFDGAEFGIENRP